jgi:hypothetical protein
MKRNLWVIAYTDTNLLEQPTEYPILGQTSVKDKRLATLRNVITNRAQVI